MARVGGRKENFVEVGSGECTARSCVSVGAEARGGRLFQPCWIMENVPTILLSLSLFPRCTGNSRPGVIVRVHDTALTMTVAFLDPCSRKSLLRCNKGELKETLFQLIFDEPFRRSCQAHRFYLHRSITVELVDSNN